MQVKLNGKPLAVNTGACVCDVLENLELPRFFAVEYNKNIIYKEDYVKTVLKEGDELEIAAFCGGG
ncbi:sulfur carrier protein [Candidatus Gastranaerophilus sp. (ex Termes propinquus)]|nr:sulfur carrier protein [Candidatus Gastranaerophilus sp. (ex Termes propinquus)]